MPPMMSHSRRAYFDSRLGLLVAAASGDSDISHLQVAPVMRGRHRPPFLYLVAPQYRFKQAESARGISLCE